MLPEGSDELAKQWKQRATLIAAAQLVLEAPREVEEQLRLM